MPLQPDNDPVKVDTSKPGTLRRAFAAFINLWRDTPVIASSEPQDKSTIEDPVRIELQGQQASFLISNQDIDESSPLYFASVYGKMQSACDAIVNNKDFGKTPEKIEDDIDLLNSLHGATFKVLSRVNKNTDANLWLQTLESIAIFDVYASQSEMEVGTRTNALGLVKLFHEKLKECYPDSNLWERAYQEEFEHYRETYLGKLGLKPEEDHPKFES